MNMIDKVARAMAAKDNYCGLRGPDGERHWHYNKSYYRKLAKEAIEAMSILDDDAHNAVVKVWDNITNGQGQAYQNTRAILDAYFREALQK